MARAGESRPVLATIGDSTFLHAGLPALIDAVYNGADITVLLLDNHTTAMTGGQDHRRHRPDAARRARAAGRLRSAGARRRRHVGAQGRLLRPRGRPPDAARGDRPPRRVRGDLGPALRDRPGADQGAGAGGRPSPQCNACQSCMNLGCPALTVGVVDLRGPAQGEDRRRRCASAARCARRCARSTASRRSGSAAAVNAPAAPTTPGALCADGPRRAGQRADRRRRRPGRDPRIQGAGLPGPAARLPGQAERGARHGQARWLGVQPRALRPRGVVADDRARRSRPADRARVGRGAALASVAAAGSGVLVCDTAHRAAVLVPEPRARRGAALLARNAGRGAGARRRGPCDRRHLAVAEELGNERAANVVLLGAVSATLEFPPEAWEAALVDFVPPKTVVVNIEAFRLGREWIDRARSGEASAGCARRRRPRRMPATDVRLEITGRGARAATSASSSVRSAACGSTTSASSN